jgi:flagellar biosynthetic protein FliO
MEMIDQLAAVLVVLGLTAGAAWWLRRRGVLQAALRRPAVGKRLEGMERLTLGPQQTLHLVRMGQRALLVAATPSGCALLDSVDLRSLEAVRGPAE